MKKWISTLFILAVVALVAVPNSSQAAAKISASEYKAGDTVTVEGTIAPGKDLYVAIASQITFAPKDTTGPHEVKRFKKDGK